jgi:hypothetical protein
VWYGMGTTTTASSISASSTAIATPTETSGAVPPPAPTQSGAAPNCKKWYVAVAGDGCQSIAYKFGISLDQFYRWNPAVGSKLKPPMLLLPCQCGLCQCSDAKFDKQPTAQTSGLRRLTACSRRADLPLPQPRVSPQAPRQRQPALHPGRRPSRRRPRRKAESRPTATSMPWSRAAAGATTLRRRTGSRWIICVSINTGIGPSTYPCL